MCLLLLSLRAHPDCDVLLAGNRDEYHHRPAAPPAALERDPVIYAGRDLEAGGTWMGRNEAGLFAALTNFRSPGRGAPPRVRSRGELVLALLRHLDPADALAALAAEDPRRFRPFNLLFGNRNGFYYYTSEGEAPPRPLGPGTYVLSNSFLDDRSWPKVRRTHEFLAACRHLRGETWLLALQAFLCDATPPDDLPARDRDEEIHGNLGAVFIRSSGYGTVSSSIITEGGTLGFRYYYAEGRAMLRAGTAMARLAAADPPPATTEHPDNPFRRLAFGRPAGP